MRVAALAFIPAVRQSQRATSSLCSTAGSLRYCDVHTHLIHEQFDGDEDAAVARAAAAGLDWVVVNGLEPTSNRAVLNLCAKHPSILLPALGIYPLDAAATAIAADPTLWTAEFPPPDPFNWSHEVEYIDRMVRVPQLKPRINVIHLCARSLLFNMRYYTLT
jgi:Tat protein secretion system quality control protein TatD with DNase activity